MAEVIQMIFVNPGIAVARLGGSTKPQDAYKWVESPNPRTRGETTIAPDWSLTVQADGSVTPFMSTALNFRDGTLIKPVCPFFELWAQVGEAGSAPATWREIPLTPALLAQHGATLRDLLFRIDAQNLKVARRTANQELRYGTFPPLEIRADNKTPTPILASSPPGVPASRRMIPANRKIPLGSFQVMKSSPQPAPGEAPWTEVVNVELIRFRFTPARGHCYGPPNSALPQPDGSFLPVDVSRAFLNQNTDWVRFRGNIPYDPPQDTYDGADVGNDVSLGVVDDTCGARVEITLRLPAPANRTLTTAATIFVAPPDFAPDRRPFLSLADELNDRGSDSAARTAAMSDQERDAWVEDLFERIYETVSLLNVDRWRREKAVRLTGNRLTTPIPGDDTRQPTLAMGGHDALRNPMFPQPAESQNIQLPLAAHARMRHRSLADLDFLRAFVVQDPGRLASLIRSSFEAERGEVSTTENPIGTTTMRMPPFMRNSNGGPLTLAPWQYDLLMAWVNEIETLTTAPPPAPSPLLSPALASPAAPAVEEVSEGAARRRAEVLARVGSSGLGGD